MRFQKDKQLSVPVAICSIVLVIGVTAGLAAERSLAILPADFTLTGARAQHRLLVQQVVDGEFRGEAKNVTIVSDNPQVVEIRNGFAVAVADGVVTLTATSGDLSAATKVRVLHAEKSTVPSFRNHVLAVIAKSGCNSGSCHGALAGKGGFKLSLRGYDPESDHRAIPGKPADGASNYRIQVAV